MYESINTNASVQLRIVVFDPGGTTGVAVFDHSSTGYYLVYTGIFNLWERVEEFIKCSEYVVCEKITPHKTAFNPVGLRVSGAIEMLAFNYNKRLIYQVPSLMAAPKHWASKFIKTIKIEHCKDAVAHGLAFIGPNNISKEYINAINRNTPK